LIFDRREFRGEAAGQREPAHLEVGDRAPDRVDGDQRLGTIAQAVRRQRDGIAEHDAERRQPDLP